MLYVEGSGVERDYAQAVAWHRRAAERGLPEAQASLGFMYCQGRGVAQDDGQAVYWYRKAAERGDAWALGSLGCMCVMGKCVPQDYVEAHKWFSVAAAHATGENQQEYGHARLEIEKQMSAAEIAEAERRAREWAEAFRA